jgi:MFS family permease
MSALSPAIRRDFLGLTGAIAMVGLAMGLVLPQSALQLQAWGADAGLTGAILALHALGLVLSMPLTMPLVNRLGARPLLALATLASGLICGALQSTSHIWPLAAGLMGLGVSLGLVFNLVEAWVNDVLPDSSRGHWLAIHCTVFTLFQLLGPLLLTWLPTQRPGLLPFELCGLLLVASLPAYRLLSAHHFSAEEESVPSAVWWRLLAQAPAVVWGTALFALFDALVLGLLPVHARAHGLTDAEALRSAAVVLAGDTALEWVIGRLADRYGHQRLQWACGLVLLLGAALLPASAGHWTWWPLLFAIGGAAGGIYVLSLVACGHRFSGQRLLQMTALLGATWGAASCAGPLFTGALMDLSTRWALPGVLMASTLVLMAALAWEAARAKSSSRTSSSNEP